MSIIRYANPLPNDEGDDRKKGLHFCEAHRGKMTGMISLSTAVTINPICQKRQQVKGSICEFCFAQNLLGKCQKTMAPCNERNFRLLNERPLKKSEIPFVNAAFVRIESFGDIASQLQAENYIRIMRANKHAHFGVWTKNLAMWQAAFRHLGKPRNCSFVYSSMFVNVADTPVDKEFIDHIFTVYRNKTEAAKRGVTINCGKRNCLGCLQCYKRGGAFNINELLK